MIPELFILAIDGLGGDIVTGTDLLPNISKQCSGNIHGIVHSPNNISQPSYPFPHTWPAFTTLWTGQSEEKHGIRMPDYESEKFQNITDQPYVTIWEILDKAGFKVALFNQQMTKGLKFENGINEHGMSQACKNFFFLNTITGNNMERLRQLKSFDVIGYYTIALDYWYHRSFNVNQEMMFLWVDHLIQWCQLYCPSKKFVLLSDHGFDPDRRMHTNNAFYFTRGPGSRIDGLTTQDIPALILSHVDEGLVQNLGEKIDRDPFEFSSDENARLAKQFKEMGYL